MKEVSACLIKTPIGQIKIRANHDALLEIKLDAENEQNQNSSLTENKILSQAKHELQKYFNGELSLFEVPISLTGTSFQLSVWKRILQIPYGVQLSYSELAQSIGNPKAARAIGLINSQNILPIIVPCHRVTRLNGEIGGYSGGTEKKDWLIRLENSAKKT